MHAALLAPVPEEHLVDGATVAERYGRVAYGSRAWEVFRELDRLRRGEPVTVYIYASHAEHPVGNRVTWQGLYIGHIESLNGVYPGDMNFRPPSAQSRSGIQPIFLATGPSTGTFGIYSSWRAKIGSMLVTFVNGCGSSEGTLSRGRNGRVSCG